VVDFLARKRIAVAGVTRDPRRRPESVQYCRQHDISVIAGACPMMFGPSVDFGHRCMRWIMSLTGGLPT
jgi:hypothetical protein